MHCPSQSKGPGVPRGERLEQGGMGVGPARRAGGQGPGKGAGAAGSSIPPQGSGRLGSG